MKPGPVGILVNMSNGIISKILDDVQQAIVNAGIVEKAMMEGETNYSSKEKDTKSNSDS